MYQRILVPSDDGPAAAHALREAIDLATKHKATLVLLHVADTFPVSLEMSSAMAAAEIRRGLSQYREVLLAKAKRTATDARARVETALRDVAHGRCADAIVDEARTSGCDLIGGVPAHEAGRHRRTHRHAHCRRRLNCHTDCSAEPSIAADVAVLRHAARSSRSPAMCPQGRAWRRSASPIGGRCRMSVPADREWKEPWGA